MNYIKATFWGWYLYKLFGILHLPEVGCPNLMEITLQACPIVSRRFANSLKELCPRQNYVK